MDTDTKQFIAGEIEKLAVMVQKGFAAMGTRIDTLESTMATKEEVNALVERIEGNALHRISKLEIDVADLRLATNRLRADLEA